MNRNVLEVLSVQILIVISLVFITYYFLKIRHDIKLEKKFSKYTIKRNNKEEKSLFDKIIDILTNLVYKISKVLKKSKVIQDYGKTYEKHITYDKIGKISGIDYVSIKVLMGFILVISYLVTEAFQNDIFTLPGILFSYLVGFFIIDLYLYIEYKRRRKRISEDLLKAIIIMNNSFKSGMSIVQAIEIVKNELEGPIGDEFKKIYLDLSYGLNIEDAFNRFYQRVRLEDVKFITSSLSLLNKTGGNIVKVFKSIEREFFDKKKLTDELRTVTASSKFIYRFLLFIPFGLCFIIYILNSDYFKVLFTSPFGIFIILSILILYISYAFIIKRIMKVSIYE